MLKRKRRSGAPVADHDGDLPSFGRPPQGKRGQLTDMGCPDCRGVLAVTPMEAGHLWFTCSVGHAFSMESLLRAKEEQLETSLWTAVETYGEIAAVYGELASRANEARLRANAAAYEERARRAKANFETLRKMIASDGPPTGAKGAPRRK